MGCAIKDGKIGMAVKLNVVIHNDWILLACDSCTKARVSTSSIVYALQIPGTGKQVPIHFTDNASHSPDSEIFPVNGTLPPFLRHSPLFAYFFNAFLFTLIQKGDRPVLDVLLDLQYYGLVK
jgi:hypothetical protein